MTRRQSVRVFVASLAVILALPACSDVKDNGQATTTASSGPTITAPDPASVKDLTGKRVVQIEVQDNVYVPRFFKVSPGTKIVFSNTGSNYHTVNPATDGAFTPITQSQLAPGKSADLTLDAGNFPIYCKLHGTPSGGQRGYIIVG